MLPKIKSYTEVMDTADVFRTSLQLACFIPACWYTYGNAACMLVVYMHRKSCALKEWKNDMCVTDCILVVGHNVNEVQYKDSVKQLCVLVPCYTIFVYVYT